MMNKIYNILLYASITFLVVLLVLSIVDKAKADDPIYMKPMYGRENRGVSFILSMCSDKAKQQKKLFKKIYENATVLNAGWLYGATSNPDKCTWAARFYNDPRPKRVRIHVCNSTCFKTRQNRTCQPKECFGGYKTEAEANKAILAGNKNLFARVDRIIEMIKSDYKSAPKDKDGKSTIVDFAVSACMECSLSRDARKKLIKYVQDKLQSIEKERASQGLSAIAWVDNPLSTVDSCLSGMLCEKHGTPNVGKNGIADNDGHDYDTINQIDYWTKNTDAYMALAWKPCFNGAADVAGTTGSSGFIPPQNRTGYCTVKKEGPEFSPVTNKALLLKVKDDKSNYKANTTKGCESFEEFDKTFVWKLADKERNFTTWVAPAKYRKFSKVQLICDGTVVDSSYPQIGYRFGQDYSHDNPPRRKIYDFRKNIGTYPIEGFCVLHADKYCWRMQYPYFRPVKK